MTMRNSNDKQIPKELDELFLFAPPNQLRQSITQVFFSFLTNSKTDLPNNFEQVAEDIYFLLNFLEQADKNKEDKDNSTQHCIANRAFGS